LEVLGPACRLVVTGARGRSARRRGPAGHEPRPARRRHHRPGPAGRAAAAAPKTAALSSLKWGIVGSLHRVEPLALLAGQTGVVRLLPNTIKYGRPPVDVAWSEVKAEPGRFEMAWPGNPAAARSLDDSAADLRKLRASPARLDLDHPACRELDDAVFALLEVADRLAFQGWGVGLLTPGGVMLNPTAAGMEIVPVDLGFTWSGEIGEPPWEHSPGRPDWLTPNPTENPAALAWERPPVEQQFAAPAGGPYRPEPAADVRTLARVIAWALTGHPARELPGDEPAPVWDVLRAAAAGEIESVGELADRLRAGPPSTHFAARGGSSSKTRSRGPHSRPSGRCGLQPGSSASWPWRRWRPSSCSATSRAGSPGPAVRGRQTRGRSSTSTTSSPQTTCRSG
jgi:hypothetical protein